jgi:hypothetical protein
MLKYLSSVLKAKKPSEPGRIYGSTWKWGDAEIYWGLTARSELLPV